MDQAALQTLFREFDTRFFGGRLAGGTLVLLDPQMSNYGYCERDATIIRLSSLEYMDEDCTLIHEMTHAYVARFGSGIVVTTEATAAAEEFGHGYGAGHTPDFFSKLFEVMRNRGHNPVSHFDWYCGTHVSVA
jgi:hypothetical protein